MLSVAKICPSTIYVSAYDFAFTVTSHTVFIALFNELDTVILAFPFAIAFTTPLASTVAMSLLELDHFNDLYVASSGNTSAVNVWVSPTYIISDVCDNDTDCTAMLGLYSLS